MALLLRERCKDVGRRVLLAMHQLGVHVSRVPGKHLIAARRSAGDVGERGPLGIAKRLRDVARVGRCDIQTTSTGGRAATHVFSTKLCTGELSESILEILQHRLSHVKLILCNSKRAPSAREETELPCVLVRAKLSDDVVWPRRDLLAVYVLDGDGGSREVEQTGATVVAHHGLSTGWELWCVQRKEKGREGGSGREMKSHQGYLYYDN